MILMASLTAGAWAGPTAVNWIPIADVIKHREVAISQYWYGTERHIDQRWYPGWSVQVGLGNRIEGGLDHDYLGNAVGNVKLSLLEGHPKVPNAALAVGVMNWSGKVVDPYVVGRFDLKGLRLHGGWVRTGGASRLMAGMDFPITGSITGMVDGYTGPGSLWWIGASGNIDAIPGLNVWAGAGIPGRRSDGTQFGVVIGYFFRL